MTFIETQKNNLLELRDSLLSNMEIANKESRQEQSAGSGEHMADAGSDAYDRDFALSMLANDKNSFLAIENALKRIANGTYGVCEMCGKKIPHERLQALPFALYTVDCQSIFEKAPKAKIISSVAELFSPDDDEETEEAESEEA